MADGGPLALPAPPALPAPQPPIVMQPAPPVQLIVPPVQPIPTQPIQPAHIPQVIWSHFKAEFASKPDQDTEAHLLRTYDWMDIHAFLEGVKVQYFCLTLVGEARLWYESLRPINVDCNELQNQYRQQYSKIGNSREQLFYFL